MAFKIKGLDAVLKKLERLPERTANQILKKGFKSALEPMRDAVKANVPVDTGALRDAVTITPAKNKRGRVFANVRMGAKDFTGDQFYGSFLNYGYTRNGILYPPNPFMKRGFDATHDQVRERAVAVIGPAIEAALNE